MMVEEMCLFLAGDILLFLGYKGHDLAEGANMILRFTGIRLPHYAQFPEIGSDGGQWSVTRDRPRLGRAARPGREYGGRLAADIASGCCIRRF